MIITFEKIILNGILYPKGACIFIEGDPIYLYNNIFKYFDYGIWLLID
jgi:hypothetical protein